MSSTIPPSSENSSPAPQWSCPLECHCGPAERAGCTFCRALKTLDRADRRAVDFTLLPPAKTAEIYGVRYIVIEAPGVGQLLVTRFGWPWLDALLPEKWYAEGRYWRDGERLGQSTGTVYRFTSRSGDRPMDIVVKVSRCAQEVPLFAAPSLYREIARTESIALRFNNPFEEFGRLNRLREQGRGPRIFTKRPLAIFSPADPHPLWELGRGESNAAAETAAVARQQTDPARTQVVLDAQRDYFLLFGWVRGTDVSTLAQREGIGSEEMETLARTTLADLRAGGMTVLDHKPAHVIVRPDRRRGGLLRRRDGRVAYALVDYELLVDLPP